MGPAYVSVDRGTDGKMWYTNTREWYSAIKRNEIMSFADTGAFEVTWDYSHWHSSRVGN